MARGKSGSATCTFTAKFTARGSSEQMDLATAASIEEPPLIDDASIATRAQKRRRTSFRQHSSPPKRTKHEHSPTEGFTAPPETPINGPATALEPAQHNLAREEDRVDEQDDSENVQEEQSQGEAQEEVTEGRTVETGTATISHAEDTIDQAGEIFDAGNDSTIRIAREVKNTINQDPEAPTPINHVGAAPTVISSSPQFSNPDGYLMKQVISTLDRAAEDMLDCFLDFSSDDMHQLVEHLDTHASRVWSTLLDLFDPYRRVYSQDEHYIKPSDFVGFPPSSYTSMYKANLASAICTLLNPTPENLAQLHTHFLEIFVRPEGRMVEWQSVVLHELKTQLCIARIQENTLPIYSTLNDIFPGNIEQLFRQQGLGFNGPHLSPTEITFLNQCSQTRQRFLGAGSLEAIARAYPWREYLQAISRHMMPHVEIVLGRTAQQNKSANPASNSMQSTRAAKVSTSQNNGEGFGADDDDPYNDDEILRSATLAAHAAMGGQGFSTPTYEANRESQENAGKRDQNPESPFSQELASQAASSTTLQHTSTQEQYEKARLAATARAAAKAKGNASNQSHRRPWTPEEENALMRGLDEVKGPHWSQILLMYGPGGRISEILKDRNQVQLKDKARNLKLFFLKSGREVPASLKEVTGELKTRAPQAAKSEAMKDADENEMDATNGEAPIENDSEAVPGPSASPELRTPAPEDTTDSIQDGSPAKPPEEDESMAEAIQQAMQAVNATNALQTAS